MVEFGPDNAGLALMTLDALQIQGAKVLLPLRHSRAVCKPAQQHETVGPCYAEARKTEVAACC